MNFHSRIFFRTPIFITTVCVYCISMFRLVFSLPWLLEISIHRNDGSVDSGKRRATSVLARSRDALSTRQLYSLQTAALCVCVYLGGKNTDRNTMIVMVIIYYIVCCGLQ